MPGLPSGLKVEIEWSAGVWTDVTAYVDARAGVAIRKGRSSEFDAVQPGTLQLVLFNDDGRFTPRSQLLKDGSAHPFYPNVQPRKQIRVSYSASGTKVRFLGRLDGFPLAFEGGSRPKVAIAAVDSQRSWSETKLRALWKEQVLALSPLYFWPLTEESGSLEAANLGSVPGAALSRRDKNGGKDAALGADLKPYAEAGTTLYANEGLTSGDRNGKKGSWFEATLPANLSLPFTLVFAAQSVSALNQDSQWVAPMVSIRNPFDVVAGVQGKVTWLKFPVPNAGTGNRVDRDSSGGTDPLPLNQWRVFGVTFNADFTVTAYLDAVAEPVTGLVSEVGNFNRALAQGPHRIQVGGDGSNFFQGRIGPVAIFSGTLSGFNQGLLNYALRTGFAPEGSGSRAVRLAALAGVTMTVASDEEPLGVAAVEGQTVAEALADVAASEGAGSAVGVAPDGTARLWGRPARNGTTPVLTLSAITDVSEELEVDFSDAQIVNVGSVAGLGGRESTAIDAASISSFGTIEASVRSVRATSAGDRQLAESLVAAGATPRLRLSKVNLDLLTSESSGLYAAIDSLVPGALIRVTDLPATSPRSYLDVRVEGWTETYGVSTALLVLDTSPADVGGGIVVEDSLLGRLAGDGLQTLTSAIASGATSISVTTSSGPTLSTAAGDYPMNLAVGEEVLIATAAPGSAVSPQTLTVTRAALGTRAAAQSAGATVLVAPDPVLGL
jgi:hypothetical protein